VCGDSRILRGRQQGGAGIGLRLELKGKGEEGLWHGAPILEILHQRNEEVIEDGV